MAFSDALAVLLKEEGGQSCLHGPRAACNNLISVARVNTEYFPKIIISGVVFGMNSFDCVYKLIRVFCQIAIFPVLPIKSFCSRMMVIFGVCRPFKVIQTVVSFIAVNVINYHAVFLLRQKCFCDQPMNKSARLAVKGHADIASGTNNALYWLSRKRSFAAIFINKRSAQPSNIANVRHLIAAFKTNNVFPNFIHGMPSFSHGGYLV